MIRIANGQGFWGDWLEAPARLLEQGPVDYLMLDYLAEVTMSILQKQRRADTNLGYARDFPPLIAGIASHIRDRRVRVIANAGGVNPIACAREVRRLAPGLRVAVVLGDDLFDQLDDLLAAGHEMRNMDNGEPLASIRPKVLSVNAYTGAFPVADALATGADVVITGRCADPALALAPMIHEFGWQSTDWDRLAAGIVAGHSIECGAQSSGGNCQVDWTTIPDLANIGYPIVEMEPDGNFSVTKHPGTGGRIDSHGIKEQLIYEIGDPARYITPDVVADFTSVLVRDDGPDRVRITGVKGSPATPTLKLSVSYLWGWKSIGTLVYSYPDAVEKARAADRIVRQRLEQLGLRFDEIYTELFGFNACHGPAARTDEKAVAEVQLRIGVRGHDKAAVDRFTRELIPLVLSGPPGGTGYGDGRPAVREVVAFWPALVPREVIRPSIEVVE
ncbi:MAG: acyclic terpene utilization AtuA family protein [Bryobacteraceae bacterium]|nr:acyclic terpene utilization AtuA family protein [Bryobacteraceae bacterium]